MQSTSQKRKTDKEKLFSKIREEKVTLFIGSGFSIRAGAPSARDIVKAIKDKCPQIKQTELKDVAREYIQRNNDDKEKLIEILRSIFPQHACCDDNQKALTRLPHFKQIFTTNYDSFIEDAYDTNCHVVRTDKDLTDCSDNIVQIYKLHGDFINQENLIITDDDYNDFFDHKKNSLIWAPLKLAMMNTHMLFIGYSLDNSNVFRILQNIRNICNASPREMYMIAPTAEEYKANREAMPDPMRIQMGLIYEGLKAFNIPIYTKEGFEADDVIGTISRRACELGHKVYILTGDQDSFQLIRQNGCIKVIIPSKGELMEYGWDQVYQKLGVYPDQVIDYKALRGDTSDNIPGIRGIGEKTAVKLLDEFKTVDNVLAKLVDPLLIGMSIHNNVLGAVKSVEKTDPKERVGVFCRKNKR